MKKEDTFLHYVTQAGQPYRSTSRKCDKCGKMCWPGMAGTATRWTDQESVWVNAQDNCFTQEEPDG